MTPELPQALRVALRVVDVLEDMGIRYHLGGSYASSIHGIPRQTQDIDLVVDLTEDSGRELARRLSGEFYADTESAVQAARHGTSFNLIHLDTAIKVDLFVRATRPSTSKNSAVIARRRCNSNRSVTYSSRARKTLC